MSGGHRPPASAEVHRARVQYPGGLAARYRWAGSGQSALVFSVSEVGGRLHDLGSLVAAEPDRLCRAELRIEGPLGTWSARFASLVYDEPAGALWDTPGLLLVKYGFHVYALGSRSGELVWSRACSTPVIAVITSPRLDHALLQTELETLAVRTDGEVAWRAGHADVIVAARLVAGSLLLDTYGGQQVVLDSRSGLAGT